MDFGINLVFGSKADQPMTNEQRLFLPEELMFYLSEAHLSDGTPLVIHENIAPFEIDNVPWYAILGLVYLVLLAIVIFLTFFSVHPLVGFSWRLLILPLIHLCARLIYWLR